MHRALYNFIVQCMSVAAVMRCNILIRASYAMQCIECNVLDSAEDQLCNAMHGQGCMREGFRHCVRVNNPLKLISVAFQLVFPIHPLTAVIASFAEDNYGEGLSGCCRRICASRNRCAWVF